MLLPMPVGHVAHPDHHHLDLGSFPIPVIVRGTTAASFAHGVFMLQTMRVTTSASSLPNSPGVAVTAEMVKHGGYKSVVRTTLQRKAQAKRQRSSLATSPIFQTLNQSRIKWSQRSCRRRCERQWPMPSTSFWTLSTIPPMNRQFQQAKQISDSSLPPIL